MHALMMDVPLMISSIFTHASRFHGDTEVVTRTSDGSIHRSTYRALAMRAPQLAHALRALGVEPGDRIATLAWNTRRHVELYYGIAGIGAGCHTIRLHDVTIGPGYFETKIVRRPQRGSRIQSA